MNLEMDATGEPVTALPPVAAQPPVTAQPLPLLLSIGCLCASRNIPRVVKFVFWRILLFYLLSILLIGLNVPWDYPDLSNKTITTSPFTQAGSNVAASFMNTVILASVLSAGNHALFAGTRVLYGLSVTSPRQAPALFSKPISAPKVSQDHAGVLLS